MAQTQLFEPINFDENPLYERIIADLLEKKFSIVDGFFDLDEVGVLRQTVLKKYKKDNFKKAAIGNRTNELIAKNVRGDFIMWINEAETEPSGQLFFKKINALVEYLNRTCFMGILHKEFHYAIYPEGTFYKRHLDTFQNDGRRKLSIVCYLNDESWQIENGGELTIYTLDNRNIEKEFNIYPLPGRMVIFESQELEHEVKKVKYSQRLSITGWLKTR